jgi:hypothetical protein
MCFVALLVYALVVKSFKIFRWVFGIAILQNINLGIGIDLLPYTGLILSLATVLFILFGVKPFTLK